MERRFIAAATASVQLQKRDDGQPPRISGYGAVFYDGTPATEYVLWDMSSERCVERIMPGAFSKAMSRPDDCRALFNHNPDLLLGRTASKTLTLNVDGRGLAYSIDPGNTSIANDVQEHLKRGDVTGSSFSFTVDEERWTETKDGDKWFSVREIQSVTLYDVGPVTFPAYTSTTANVRSADCQDARSAFEKRKQHLGTILRNYSNTARVLEILAAD